MKEFEYIDFDCGEYPIYQITPNEEVGTILVSTEQLNHLLINGYTGLPVNDEAEEIDNSIYAYLPTDLLNLGSEKEIVDYFNHYFN